MKTEIQVDNSYLENNITANESGNKRKFKKSMQEPFKVLTFIITIYPILPLALLSLFVSVFGLFGFFSDLITKGYSFTQVFSYAGLLIWLLGGTAGFIGLVRFLMNKIDLTSLLLILYGTVSYSIIAVMYVMVNFRNPNWLSLLHVAYILFSLIIIGMLLTRTFKTVLRNRRKANI